MPGIIEYLLLQKLKQIAEDNGNCLAVLRNERDSLAEKLELRKAL